jgi:hypothetical protein
MTKKPKLGRPPLAGKSATVTIKIRVTPEVAREWERRAGRLSLSQWIREKCNTR